MRTRIITALVGIPLVLGLVFAAPPALFGAAVLGLALLALHEYLRLCGVEGRLHVATMLAGALALGAVPAGVGAPAAAAALLAVVLTSLRGVGDPAVRFRGVAESVLGLAYIGLAMASLWMLAALPQGRAWVFLVLVATWAGDSAAYFVGSRFGRRRLAPTLSPKKSWEGAAAGLAASVAGALLAGLAFREGAPSPGVLAASGLAVAVAGQLGDLFESLWKRAKGVKDSGTIIPGHGGILDRIDSLLLAFPVAWHLAERWSR